jgi:antitoxin (DNA-binding transcriptional repressor) of toxin-antitoxin stability system
MARMNATQLRIELYRVLDRILETGEEVEIERNGRLLRISPKKAAGAWDRLVERPGAVRGSPDDLVDIDWSDEWKP